MQHVAAIIILYNTKMPLRLPAGKDLKQLRGVFENNCAFTMEEAFRAIDKKKPERPRRRLSYRYKNLYGKRAAIKYSKNFKTKDVFNLDEILCVEPIQIRA